MKIEESLADIETEVGRINMDLQANEHERRDLVRLHEDIKSISEELQGVFDQQERYSERFQEGSVKFGKAQEQDSRREPREDSGVSRMVRNAPALPGPRVQRLR